MIDSIILYKHIVKSLQCRKSKLEFQYKHFFTGCCPPHAAACLASSSFSTTPYLFSFSSSSPSPLPWASRPLLTYLDRCRHVQQLSCSNSVYTFASNPSHAQHPNVPFDWSSGMCHTPELLVKFSIQLIISSNVPGDPSVVFMVLCSWQIWQLNRLSCLWWLMERLTTMAWESIILSNNQSIHLKVVLLAQ